MSHVSSLALHRFRYGELDDAESAALREHLDACPRCADRLRAQEANRAAFVLEPVPAAVRGKKQRSWGLWVAIPLLATALLLTVAQPPTEGTRTKGAVATVELWVDADDGPRAVPEGGRLKAGDRVQIRVRRPPAPWITLAGRDDAGEVEVYGTWKARTDTAEWQAAPFALGLDETTGEQRIHAVFTGERPAALDVRRALSNEGAVAPVHVETLTFETVP